MWVLDSEGDVFGGRKIWLCPGKSYLFGRTKTESGPDHQNIIISNKSVSRKHLTITVSPVEPGSGTNAFSRSKVTLTDDSKIGSTLNGERFCKTSKSLGKSVEHNIQLGSFSQLLRIRWRKVGFSFCYTTKQTEKEDVLAPFRERLEPLDIKTYLDYLPDETEFLVSNKRNIPKGLQALINGKFIVQEEYIDLVVAAATSPGLTNDGTYVSSKLEENIDENWPDARPFVPEPGKEPVPRSAESYYPDPGRANIFEGLSFVFGDEGQRSSLMPAIAAGGAKCFLHPIKIHETRVSEFVDYIDGISGNKKGGTVADVENDGNVVFVRINRKGSDDDKDWVVHFIRDVDAQRGQESIEQNEFLDAILQNNARQLIKLTQRQERQTRQDDSQGGSRARNRQVEIDAPSSTAPTNTSNSRSPNDNAAEPPRKARRLIARSRFKGFDDFDASQIPKAEPPPAFEDESNVERGTRSNARANDSQSLFVSDSPAENTEESRSRATRGSKRGRELSVEAPDERNANSILDSLVPTANALKKRRMNETHTSTQDQEQFEDSSSHAQNLPKHERDKREIDVRAHAQSHAKQLDAKSRFATKNQTRKQTSNGRISDRDDTGQGEENDDISPEEMHRLQALAIEEFDVPTLVDRDSRQDRSDSPQNSRWRPEWNGRKNFKAFKRAKDRNEASRPRQVMPQTFIAMVDAKVKDFGVGQAYLEDDDEDEDRTVLSRREREEEDERLREEDDAMMDSDVEMLESRSVRSATKTSKSTSQSQASTQHKQGASGSTVAVSASPTTTRAAKDSKRQATSSAEAAPPAKRTRQSKVQTRARQADEEDEEDELRFRRRRR